ncbi:hypothetical protein BaRGS_00009963 [Batillaria attramentaria]|uniref:G-protein coupled receptors family 1 profile domain-containing protein n=1 Tax=Batillaria attramentaria TaxID=370345 RepID=A0ABD0LI16_9CAEN
MVGRTKKTMNTTNAYYDRNRTGSPTSAETQAEFLSNLSRESFRNRGPVFAYLMMLIVVGTVGNILVLLVYWLRIRPDVPRVFILAMGVCDLLTSVVGLPLQLATIRYAYDTYSLWFCRGMFAAATFPTQCSGLLLVVIAVQRFQRVRYPNSAMDIRDAWNLVAVSVFLTLIFFAPFVPLYGIRTKTVDGIAVKMCWIADEYSGQSFQKVMYNIVIAIFFLGGLIVMVFAYSHIGYLLWTQRKLFKSAVTSVPSSVVEGTSLKRKHMYGDHVPPRPDYLKGLAVNTVIPVSQLPSDLRKITERTEKAEGIISNTPPVTSPPRVPEAMAGAEHEETESQSDDEDTPYSSQDSSSSDSLKGRPGGKYRRKGDQGRRHNSLHADSANVRDPSKEKHKPWRPHRERVMSSNQERAPGRLQTVTSSHRPNIRPSASDPYPYTPSACNMASKYDAFEGYKRIQERTTRMMAVLTILYVINWLPHLIARFKCSEPVNWCENFHNCGWNGYAIALRSYYVNSGVNAFVGEILSELSAASFRHRLPVVVYLITIAIVGMIGNILVLVVYRLRMKPSAIRVFIVAMAVYDLFTCVVSIPVQLVTIRYAYDTNNVWFCKAMFATATIPTQASGFILVFIAVERRSRLSSHPHVNISVLQAWRLVRVTLIVSIVIFGPFTAMYGIHTKTVRNVALKMCWVGDEYLNAEPDDTIVFRVVLVTVFIGGSVSIMMAYFFLARALWKRSQFLKQRVTPGVQSTAENTVENAFRGKSFPPLIRLAHDTIDRLSTIMERTEDASTKGHSCSRSTEETDMKSGSKVLPLVFTKETMVAETHSLSVHSDRVSESSTEMPSTGVDQTNRNNQNTYGECEEESEEGDQSKTQSTQSSQQTLGWYFVLHDGSDRSASSFHNTTRMMIILTILYVINWLPHIVIRIIRVEPINWCDNFTDCGWNGEAIALRSMYLNSAVNAFVYSFCNPVFRQECLAVLGSVCSRRCVPENAMNMAMNG